jgi:hypothetical protein
VARALKQIPAAFKGMWEQANKKNWPFLPYDADSQRPGPPQRIAPPQLDAAAYQESLIASEDMKARPAFTTPRWERRATRHQASRCPPRRAGRHGDLRLHRQHGSIDRPHGPHPDRPHPALLRRQPRYPPCWARTRRSRSSSRSTRSCRTARSGTTSRAANMTWLSRPARLTHRSGRGGGQADRSRCPLPRIATARRRSWC